MQELLRTFNWNFTYSWNTDSGKNNYWKNLNGQIKWEQQKLKFQFKGKCEEFQTQKCYGEVLSEFPFLFVSCTRIHVHEPMHAGDMIHIPANGYTLLHWAIGKEMLQWASQGRKRRCKIVDMDVNNAEFQILRIWALQMFYEQEKTLLLNLGDTQWM